MFECSLCSAMVRAAITPNWIDSSAAGDNGILFDASVQNMTINAFLMPFLLCALLYPSLLPPTMDIYYFCASPHQLYHINKLLCCVSYLWWQSLLKIVLMIHRLLVADNKRDSFWSFLDSLPGALHITMRQHFLRFHSLQNERENCTFKWSFCKEDNHYWRYTCHHKRAKW